MRRLRIGIASLALVVAGPAACTATPSAGSTPEVTHSSATPSAPSPATSTASPLPGMPPPIDPGDVYAADRPGLLAPAARRARPLVYVPNFGSGTVSIIDPATYRVIRTVRVGAGPQHVVPSWDLRTLWVNNDNGNSLTPIDPATGRFGAPVRVDDPYNLYFTPDGRFAIVMAESRRQIVFRDPHTMAVRHVLPAGCAGVNHADFSADGRYFIATCEFSSQLVKVDTQTHKVLGYIPVPKGGMPQDIKMNPSGTLWYVSDMQNNGVWTLDGDQFKINGFIPTGPETHGLYPSRDAKQLYISNRGGMGPGGDKGSVSVLDFATNKIVATWPIAPPSTPDMGGVSPDGKTLWLSGRRNNEVYGIDTTTGKLVARIKVGREPHGLAVWPQPGRYSLGHTGILR